MTQEAALKAQLVQEIAEAKAQVVTLKRSEIDMQAEIEQLKKLLEQKTQDMSPLRSELDALRAEKADALEEQSQQQNKNRNINLELVAAENNYQAILDQLRALEAEKQSLIESVN